MKPTLQVTNTVGRPGNEDPSNLVQFDYIATYVTTSAIVISFGSSVFNDSKFKDEQGQIHGAPSCGLERCDCHYFITKLEAMVLFMTIGSDTGLEHNCKVTRLPSTSSVCLVFVELVGIVS